MANEEEIQLGFLEGVEVDVDAEIASFSLRLESFLELQPGSVVELETALGAPLVIAVGGSRLGRGKAVSLDQKRGIQIVEIENARS